VVAVNTRKCAQVPLIIDGCEQSSNRKGKLKRGGIRNSNSGTKRKWPVKVKRLSAEMRNSRKDEPPAQTISDAIGLFQKFNRLLTTFHEVIGTAINQIRDRSPIIRKILT